MTWLACQLGAREHYAVPRALHRDDMLSALITDAWVPPGKPLGIIHRSLRNRFHPDLKKATVISRNAGIMRFEAAHKLRGVTGWNLILARNEWFQQHVMKGLRRLSQASRQSTPSGRSVLFSFSYAAREAFQWAREMGIATVIGQIDGGPAEEQLVARLCTNGRRQSFCPAPASYWERWREECELADRIVVNSQWSYDLLAGDGIPKRKMRIIPLAYDPPAEAADYTRSYPDRFTSERPLRVLFLGQLIARKGAWELLESLRYLANEPIELWLVGPVLIDVEAEFREHPNIRWVGVAPRNSTASWYRQADVFILPTHSDGFGMTQLEAQAWKLPVVASAFCGDVVESGMNGLRLNEVTPIAIADALRTCLREPALLGKWSANSRSLDEFSIDRLRMRLLALAEEF
jgi:glycosyltransferase involved in cell wall biosynthesis